MSGLGIGYFHSLGRLLDSMGRFSFFIPFRRLSARISVTLSTTFDCKGINVSDMVFLCYLDIHVSGLATHYDVSRTTLPKQAGIVSA
jgi:hypothetical protein